MSLFSQIPVSVPDTGKPATQPSALPEHPDLQALNAGQRAAVDAVFSFLFSDDKEFGISGPAGTGKTYLMQVVMKHVLKDYEAACALLGLPAIRFEIELAATTNKAVEVLAASTGFPAATVHTLLALRVKDNYKTGKQDTIPTKMGLMLRKKLIFVDEASMVDSVLHGYLLNMTDTNCKIIYLGDHCQMAPVNEKISPIYNTPKGFARLTQPMRNAGQPALVNLCSQLRQTVETLKFPPIQACPGVIDFVDAAGALAFVDATFTTTEPNARMLVYTNVRVNELNAYVRGLRGYPETFVEGEVLINNTVIPLSKDTNLKVEAEVTVLSVAKQTRMQKIDSRNDQVQLETYDVELWTRGLGVITLPVPVNPEKLQEFLKYYAKMKDWDVFFYLKNTFPDLRQKDAATVYKAQGSTYDTVFLDLHNIGQSHDPDQVARMLYVGASRAKSRLVLYGTLPQRFCY